MFILKKTIQNFFLLLCFSNTFLLNKVDSNDILRRNDNILFTHCHHFRFS